MQEADQATTTGKRDYAPTNFVTNRMHGTGNGFARIVEIHSMKYQREEENTLGSTSEHV